MRKKYKIVLVVLLVIVSISSVLLFVSNLNSSQETRSQGFSGFPIPFDDSDQPIQYIDQTTQIVAEKIPIYLGFSLEPVDDRTINEMSSLIGDNLTIINVYLQWGNEYNSRLTPEFFQVFQRRGVTPMITWEPWNPSMGVNQEEYSLATIISGKHDEYIRQSARAIANYNNPVFLRFAHEMNGNWYPWSGTVNGNSPEQYALAWKHVVAIFRSEGVVNVTWVWTPNAGSVPNTQNNVLASYYPGDEYVDWVGLDGYNWGGLQGDKSWRSFDQIFSRPYVELTAITEKPIMIAEVGSVESGGRKDLWFKELLSPDLGNKYPQMKALIFFNLQKEADWRIQSSVESLNQFINSLKVLVVAKQMSLNAHKIVEPK